MAQTWELNLPNGIKTPSGKWTKTVELSEMVGEDEDILVDTRRAPGGKGTLAKSGSKRISEILSRCTVSIGGEKRVNGKGEVLDRFQAPDYFNAAWSNAYLSDRGFTMVRLRQFTLGNDYIFSEVCPECHKEIKRIKVKLDELELRTIPLTTSQLDTHELILPRSGDKLTWKFIKGTDEENLEELIKSNKDQLLSVVFYQRIAMVNGSTTFGGLDYIKRLPKADRDYARMHFDEVEGGLDTELQIVCDGCNTEFTRRIQLMGKSSFFFPSERDTEESSKPAPLPSSGGGLPKLSTASPSGDGG
jgi:hypothetical protein